VTSRLELGKSGWLDELLDLYLEHRDPRHSRAALAEAQVEAPGLEPAQLAERLAIRRLEGVGLRAGVRLLSHDLSAALDRRGVDPAGQKAVGLLTVQWDILMDLAHLYRRDELEPSARRRELLAVLALAREDYELADEIRRAHLEQTAREARARGSGRASGASRGSRLPALTRKVERLLAPRGLVPRVGTSFAIGLGLAYVDARGVGRIGAVYFASEELDAEAVRSIHDLTRREKVDLIEVLLAVAWADGTIEPTERAMITEQVAQAGLDSETSTRLLGHLERPPHADDLELRPIAPESRRFIFEQAILLSLVDERQDAVELDVLGGLAERLGGSEQELEQVLVDVAAFYDAHRGEVAELEPAPGAVGRLQGLLVRRVQRAVADNARAVVTEVRETGDLARLLATASVRRLDPDESRRVKAQLLDICKTVPALAIFALPGGGMLLPVLIKLLPFNVLPSAFTDEE